jgi:Tfp pilus assembly protein PilF
MFLSLCSRVAFNRTLFTTGTVTLALILFSFSISYSQSIGGVNAKGTFGNEVIQGRIFFPNGHKSAMRPLVKLQSDSSNELTTFADSNGNFRFTRLRPESYTITVEGGEEFENAYETVSIGSPGAVPAQGNPSDYAIPTVYEVQIYLRPKRAGTSGAVSAASGLIPANISQTARKYFNEAIEAARMGQREKAIDRFKSAIAEAPNFALAYNEMGVEFLKLGEASKAANAFAAAIKLGCDDFVQHLNYGIALLSLNRFTEAEQQLRLALQKNGDAPTVHFYLGLTLMKQHQLDAAESEFKVSIAKSNDVIAAAHKYLGGIYWDRKQYSLAADELEKYIKLDPTATDVPQIRQTIKDLRSKH